MTTPRLEDLQRSIEQLVQEHIATCHRAAQAAVDRGFSRATSGRPSRRSRSRSSRTPRRSAEELTTLREELYTAVCASPGELMTAVASQMGSTPGALHLPMRQLKESGRVRSTGQRHQTRYFPRMASAAGD